MSRLLNPARTMAVRHWHRTMLAALALSATPAVAQLKAEELYQVELTDQMQPHWVWVNDVSFTRPLDGRAYLIDADSGKFLGMVSGGYAQGPLQLSPDGRSFSMVSTYYSRGTRGERTDVATLYDIKTLDQTAEIIIPPKHFISLPLLGTAPLSDDGRFLLVYNFTPEQSMTVVDLSTHKMIGETATPGCALIYPTGPRRFFMQCGDGSLQTASFTDGGVVTLGAASGKLFNDADPANEKPVRIGQATWLFTTFDSEVRIVDATGKVPAVKTKWSLIDASTKEWRIGGLQPAAYHQASGRLYTLMHVGGRDTHKDPGTEIWVYDVKAAKRVQRIKLEGPATAIAISGDEKPLLYTVIFGDDKLNIYDPASGTKLRSVDNLGNALSVIQPAPVGR